MFNLGVWNEMQVGDIAVAAIAIAIFATFIVMTRKWSDADYRSFFFTPKEEARFFCGDDDCEEAREDGC